MNIIRKFPDTMSGAQVYDMTSSNNSDKMTSHRDETLTIESYIVWEDIDHQSGEMKRFLCIRTEDGVNIATNSGVFIDGFERLADCLAMDGQSVSRIEVGSAVARNGRTYLKALASF